VNQQRKPLVTRAVFLFTSRWKYGIVGITSRNQEEGLHTMKMLAAAHSRNHAERPGDCGRSGCGHRQGQREIARDLER
jgi:hypothetical protein